MKKQAFNPYLPSWEYIPDGEPHVFENRVYVYGSHDQFNGCVFCLNDYVCYSAPLDDLSDWHYEGVIYKKTQDPLNKEAKMCLYAPDVTQGPDGRYYIYYVLDKVDVVSVAVCDTPAGEYEFYGYVHYEDGTLLGRKEGDQAQFDPAVITEGDLTYLYTGFCHPSDESRKGAMATVLASDMVTIVEAPKFIVPSKPYSAGSGYEGHEFFEGPSIRKVGDTYYFVYSSVLMHELCYATSKKPTEGFTYGGCIVSNCDLGIDSYKRIDMPTAYGANNHGGMVKLNDDWYIFYHRHTNGTWYSRQGCAEKIQILEDGSIPQVPITSCGLNQGPLVGKGEYSAYIACNIFTNEEHEYVYDGIFPHITQDGRDGDEEIGYMVRVADSTTIGFKYFDCKNVAKISVKTRGYFSGEFEVRTEIGGPVLCKIPVGFTDVWEESEAEITLVDGVYALYFTFKGTGSGQFKSFTLK